MIRCAVPRNNMLNFIADGWLVWAVGSLKARLCCRIYYYIIRILALFIADSVCARKKKTIARRGDGRTFRKPKICRSFWHWGELPEHQKRIMAQGRRTRRTQLMAKRWNKIMNFEWKIETKTGTLAPKKRTHNVKTFSMDAIIAWKQRKRL